MGIGLVKGRYSSYDSCKELEQKRYKDFRVLEEYECFYLCGKLQDGEILYRECFSKFDVDGVQNKNKRDFEGGRYY